MMLPGLTGIVFVMCGALPSLVGGYDVFPHMAVLLCCFWVIHYPTAWPLWFAFSLGLLQDVLAGTALGAQALLLMVLCSMLKRHARRVNRQNFRMLLIEVAVVSGLYMVALWLVMSWVSHLWLPLAPLVKEVLFTVLFYPLIHLLLIPILRLLPALR
jgi:rod shape-determining protein MreD